MLDIGFMEIFVIGALALIVVGPKELPGLLRSAGQMAAKVKSMAREFQRSMEDAAREADLDSVAKAVKSGGDFKKKLSVENQIVDSIKEFEKTVKTEMTEAKAAAEEPLKTPEFSKPWISEKKADADDPGQVETADKADAPQAEAEPSPEPASDAGKKSA